VFVAVAAGAVALACLLVLLPLAVSEEDQRTPAGASRPARQGEVQAVLDRASVALRARDRAAYNAALPVVGQASRAARDQLYARLAPLPWRRFVFDIAPIPSDPGRFDVRAAGMFGRVGPSDRIAGERVLDFSVLGRRVVVSGDATPLAVRRQYLMAFERPVAVLRPGGIVVADRSWRPLAVMLGNDLARARVRVAATGIEPGPPLAVYLYSSVKQLRAALGGGPSETRIRFFSAAVDRVSGDSWKTRDVGVLAGELAGQDAWRPMMLAHELTHAYTMSWFADTEHAPMLLIEGLATMVEGGRTYAPLREELASPDPQLPLLTAIATGSLWSGSSTEKVHLAYLEGASLVGYVIHEWGLGAFKRWALAVADSNLSEDGLGPATLATLGVNWRQLEAGWRQYVYTLP
jgi:hypothetical protein